MEILLILLLTTTLFYIILLILKKIEKYFFRKTKYRQSDIHRAYQDSIIINNKPSVIKSQLRQRLQTSAVSVIIVDDMAYWVIDNIFYCAKYHNGEIDTDTTQPVETENMSKDDIDKMMFILDKLGKDKEQ